VLNELLDDLWSRLRRKYRHFTTTVDPQPPESSRGTG
jgi:hypothetical protein